MSWLTEITIGQPIAHSVLVIALVALVGLTLGHIEVRGIRLGVAGVLFAGIFFGHFQVTLPSETLDFVREFGLILFVYTIGLQVGPGFFTSLRRQGLPLNGWRPFASRGEQNLEASVGNLRNPRSERISEGSQRRDSNP